MATVNIWSKVQVAVQTVLAATKTITAITKASPAVCSCTAHGYTTGQEVKLVVNGMIELNNAVVKVTSVTADTFSLDGIDSTLFNTFTSGTGQLVTFGASAATFQDVNASGGEAADIDITTIHVLAAARNGVADLSGREIQARYRTTYPGKDIDTGTVSARVNSLIAAKLLERCPDRLCSITGKTVGPVRPVAQQTRLVG